MLLNGITANGITANGQTVNGQTVNGIKLIQIYKSQITISYLMCVPTSFTNYYHLVNGNSLGRAQSDPI